LKLKRPATSAVALLTSLSVSGCSFIFSEGPPPNHQRLPFFDCSTSYAPPVLDTVFGGLFALSAVSVVGTSDTEWKRENPATETSRSSVIVVNVVMLGLLGASAIYGYSKVGQCRPAKDQLMLRMMRPAAPQAWPPPPPGYPAPPPGYPAPPPGYPAPPPGYPAPPPSYPAPPPSYPAPPPSYPAPPPSYPAPPTTPSTPSGQPTPAPAPAPAPAPKTPAPAPAPKTPPATTP
jgi:hypothetical protein